MRTWHAIDIDVPTVADGEVLQAALTDYQVAAIDETQGATWRVFFHTVTERDRARTGLSGDFPTLACRPIDVPDEDWAAKSQASVRAVQVGRIIVAPPWDVPTTIVIRPSMGFGTGHHATTRLCLAALQRLALAGRSVLDVGTGSGILAIAASLLGAGDVTGLDDDRDAIEAAWDNLALNPGSRVTLIAGDLRTTELVAADVVVANLTGALLVTAAPRLTALVAPGGRLVLSGLLAHEERDVLAACGGLTVTERGEEDEWRCLTLA